MAAPLRSSRLSISEPEGPKPSQNRAGTRENASGTVNKIDSSASENSSVERFFSMRKSVPHHQVALCSLRPLSLPTRVFSRGVCLVPVALAAVAWILLYTAHRGTLSALLDPAALSQDVFDCLFMLAAKFTCRDGVGVGVATYGCTVESAMHSTRGSCGVWCSEDRHEMHNRADRALFDVCLAQKGGVFLSVRLYQFRLYFGVMGRVTDCFLKLVLSLQGGTIWDADRARLGILEPDEDWHVGPTNVKTA